MDVLFDKDVTARKTYIDDAYWVVMTYREDGMFTYQELREIVKIRKQGGKIIPGQRYRRFVSKENGELQTWRESLPMSKLMHKYRMYEDY